MNLKFKKNKICNKMKQEKNTESSYVNYKAKKKVINEMLLLK